MTYWRKWKSLIVGGVGFLILGVWMFGLSLMEQGHVTGPSSIVNQFNTYGIAFIIVGFIMLVLGVLLRSKPNDT